jgi:Recombination endonuclease VII
MSVPTDQCSYFKKRYAEDPEFRARRRQVGNDYRRRRYADDPDYRSRCLRSCRNTRLKRLYGITVDDFDAAFAAQRGACACCHKKLGRVVRIDRHENGRVGLLCNPCFKQVDILRHIVQHAGAFERYFRTRNMTVQLERHHALLRQFGRMPRQDKAEGF